MDLATKAVLIAATQVVILRLRMMVMFMSLIVIRRRRGMFKKRKRGYYYSMVNKISGQIKHINNLVNMKDDDCVENLRMDRNCFHRLCLILEHSGGLNHTKYVSVQEQVAIFLRILAHHQKIRVIKFDFKRSGHTVSYYFNRTLNAFLKLHELFLVKPKAVEDDCSDDRWKSFKGCLGALDGTYIKFRVPAEDQVRFCTHKGSMCSNVLGVCDVNMNFVYILAGWEGSAADSRVLREALVRPTGLKVPTGNYYLCDNGYTNGEGFLTPYKGKRYHLNEWDEGNARPRDHEEYFNMKHSRARNVIERAFGVLKVRWAVLRSNTFYSVTKQCRIVMACAMLHNYIRMHMITDPFPIEATDEFLDPPDDTEYIDTVEPSQEWHSWRDNLGTGMYTNCRAMRR